MRLSVLDRSRSRKGASHADALRDTVEFAKQAEDLGYHRFWVSEHHSVPGVAGSAPTVLAAAVASATAHIRVGTGGVMLPNHQPMVVAEQFGVLESLFPGRIDMGLGRSVGFTDGIRRALARDKQDADRFGEQVRQLLGFLDGSQRTYPGVHAFPAEGLRIPPFLLATGSGADLAAELGLPLVIAAVHGEQRMLDAIGGYRENFVPSAWSPYPYVVVSVTAAAAETAEQAERLLLPEAWSTAYARTHGVFPPLSPPDEVRSLAMTDRERKLFTEALRGQIRGTGEDAARELRALAERAGADEVLLTTSTYDRAELLDSYARLAVSFFNRSATTANTATVSQM